VTLTLGSLFAGIGGFDLGFERAGFKTIWQCEIDKAAQGVLRRHFPDAKLHSDVCQVGAHNLEPVDVVTFGSPCFPAGVLVLTRRGLLPIEEVVVGDEVVSHLGRWQPVVRVGSKIAPTLRLKGQGHPGLVTTEEHPFWASAVGADLTLSPQEWVPAKDMKGRLWAQLTSIPAEAKRDYEQVCHRMGPVLHNGYRMGLVRECAPTGNEERVYNIEVEGDHSYTADGIIVHNCQDLSVAGKRAGLAGGRSGLFHEAARIIRELRERYGKPDFAIWENVPGAFSSNEGRDFAVVVQAMVDLGARDVAWRVLDSRYFGVAQRRRRVFLVADFGGERAEQILFEPESLRGDIAKGGKKRKGAPAGIGAGAEGSGREWPARLSCTLNTAFGTKMGLEDQHALAGASMFVPTYWDGGQLADTLDASVATHRQTMPERRRFAAVLEPPRPVPMINIQGSRGLAVAQADGPSYTLNAMHGHDVHAVAVPVSQPIPFDTTQITSPSNYSSPKAGVVATMNPIAGPLDASYGRGQGARGGAEREFVALTCTAGKGATEDGTGRGVPITVRSPMQVRRLTPTECERLQGFPDGWTSEATLPDGTIKPQADGPRYKQLGNAVTVNVAEWIGRRLAATLQP